MQSVCCSPGTLRYPQFLVCFLSRPPYLDVNLFFSLSFPHFPPLFLSFATHLKVYRCVMNRYGNKRRTLLEI